MEGIRTAAALLVRSMVLSVQSAGQQRLLFLQRAILTGDQAGELTRLREENRRLRSANRMLTVPAKWRWDTSDSPVGLPVSPAHSTCQSAFKTDPPRMVIQCILLFAFLVLILQLSLPVSMVLQ